MHKPNGDIMHKPNGDIPRDPMTFDPISNYRTGLLTMVYEFTLKVT